MHIHKQLLLTDVPNSWPFCKPTVGRIIVQASLGEEESGKFSIFHHL